LGNFGPFFHSKKNALASFFVSKLCNFAPKKTLDDGFFYLSLGFLIFKFKSKCANNLIQINSISELLVLKQV
jgi:hypothetical protein